MGAWGYSTFENDAAVDWAGDLLESDAGMEFVITTLQKAESASLLDYMEIPECSMALAAAEVLAALNGCPANELPEDLYEWIGRQDTTIQQPLLELASKLVLAIASRSELKDAWEDTEDYLLWRRTLDSLKERLRPS